MASASVCQTVPRLRRCVVAGGVTADRCPHEWANAAQGTGRHQYVALTGIPLMVLLATLAVVVPVATLVLWSRLRGPRAARWACRLGMLLAGQLATVLLVCAVANNFALFYSSWGELLGTGGTKTAAAATYGAPSANIPSSQRGAAPARSSGPLIGQFHKLGSTSWSQKSQWRTRGEVESVQLTGIESGLSNRAYVYLPPEYFTRTDPHRRFPAVEVLTGYPGAAINLVSRMHYPTIALNLVRSHRSVPMIYVMMSSTVASPRDTECTNVPGGPQAETYLANEVPSAVQSALPVEPGHWGIVGDSTGGYCAAKITMYHVPTFAAGVSLSGYYFADHDRTTGDLWGRSLERRHRNDLEWALAHRPAPPVSLYVTISRQETHSDGYPDTMKFLREVKPPMHVTAVIEPTGGHNFAAWDRELPAALHWFSERTTART